MPEQRWMEVFFLQFQCLPPANPGLLPLHSLESTTDTTICKNITMDIVVCSNLNQSNSQPLLWDSRLVLPTSLLLSSAYLGSQLSPSNPPHRSTPQWEHEVLCFLFSASFGRDYSQIYLFFVKSFPSAGVPRPSPASPSPPHLKINSLLSNGFSLNRRVQHTYGRINTGQKLRGADLPSAVVTFVRLLNLPLSSCAPAHNHFWEVFFIVFGTCVDPANFCSTTSCTPMFHLHLLKYFCNQMQWCRWVKAVLLTSWFNDVDNSYVQQ